MKLEKAPEVVYKPDAQSRLYAYGRGRAWIRSVGSPRIPGYRLLLL